MFVALVVGTILPTIAKLIASERVKQNLGSVGSPLSLSEC
jgi:hypothetical protein